MKVIAGLGNPGARYARTRHNLGFMAADLLAAAMNVSFTRMQDNALLARVHHAGTPVLILKPQTFMNNSGRAVGAIARRNGCKPEDILVIVDDKELPLGSIRVRPDGSAGGHNGLKSIGEHLGSVSFPRMRLGVAAPIMAQMEDLSAFVLSRFRPDEKTLVEEMTKQAVQAALCWLESDINTAMNRFNQRGDKRKDA